MEITFLGTGTSMGIPIIGCQCDICRSSDPRDKRTRTSAWIEIDGKSIVIDAGIDFRQQALREDLRSVDAILYTHHHADHIFGLDEVRPINFFQKKSVLVYSSTKTAYHLNKVYDYAFKEEVPQSDIPMVEKRIFFKMPFSINQLEIRPIPLYHGKLSIVGFRINNFAYCTDVSSIPRESYKLLQNLDCLVLGALRYSPHPNHFTIEQAVREAQKIGARQSFFVHMSHEISHEKLSRELPNQIKLAYDGLKIKLD